MSETSRFFPGISAAAKFLGFRLIQTRKGSAAYEFRPGPGHRNTAGSLHGGILCALADEAMGRAFKTFLPAGCLGVTVECKINFLSPVFDGDCLRALAKVLSRGKSLFYVECSIRNALGKLVAKAAGTFRIVSGTFSESDGKSKPDAAVRRVKKGLR